MGYKVYPRKKIFSLLKGYNPYKKIALVKPIFVFECFTSVPYDATDYSMV